MKQVLVRAILGALLFGGAWITRSQAAICEVRQFGATGNGSTLDTGAINRAIAAAAAAGGGTVVFSPGTYLSGSIRLRSNIVLLVGAGARLVGAPDGTGAYDAPENNPAAGDYEDFGHRHWHDSLIWGENLHDIAIVGLGVIDGGGMTRSNKVKAGDGDKILGLKLCRNVVLRDLTMVHGGHFAILATGVDNFLIDDVKIDTDRDGMDIDACRNGRISNCSVNSPRDDGICLKSSYALGCLRATQDVTIDDCYVSGYEEGTMIDGTRQGGGGTGRIKLGTESNGGFKDIAITNCIFDHCRGLALETVDGGDLENVAVSNLTMRDVSNSPIFIRLGDRGQGPHQPAAGHLRRVSISNVVVTGASATSASIIAGIPGSDITGISLTGVRILTDGGGSAREAAIIPAEQVAGYPDPNRFGTTPAYAFYCRHVANLQFNDIVVSYARPEFRPAFVLQQSRAIRFDNVQAAKGGGPAGIDAQLRECRDVLNTDSPGFSVR